MTVGTHLRQFTRFALVGCLATATHVAVFFTLQLGLQLHPTIATTIAFGAAVGVSYHFNSRWTFRAERNHVRHVPRFLAIALGCALLNAAIMQVGVEVFGLSPTLCLGIIIITLPALSFGLQRYWGFR